MSKVKMNAKTEVEFIHNFKILQTAFSKKKIDRYIDVDKLSKRSFQYNMEFLQFMKCYWDMHAPNGDGPQSGAFADAAVENNPPSVEKPARAAKPAAEPAASAKGMSSGPKRAGAGPNQRQPAPKPASERGSLERKQRGAQQLALEVTELKLSVENLERERDFYYSKLREVEVLCQANEGNNVPFLQQVLDILYKTDDADEFVTPEEDVIPAN